MVKRPLSIMEMAAKREKRKADGRRRYWANKKQEKDNHAMSSITAADLKLGGRLVAACDAMSMGHLNRAAGIFSEIADDLNTEATNAGLLAPDEDDWSSPMPTVRTVPDKRPDPQDLQMCARNVHSYGPPAPVTGWRECAVCGNVNVAPPEGGPVDMSPRPLGDM